MTYTTSSSEAIHPTILNKILDLSRKVLQRDPHLSLMERQTTINESQVFNTVPSTFSRVYRSELESYKQLLLGLHPIFESERFLSVLQYSPLEPKNYETFHRIPYRDYASDTHGNNYVYAHQNLRNGVLFSYHDIETGTFIPVTFNTNAPITMVGTPFRVNGNETEILRRMLDDIQTISQERGLRNFPLVLKGLSKESVTDLSREFASSFRETDPDASTIPAEMNYPALAYRIDRLKSMVSTGDHQGMTKKPKVIRAVNRINKITYCTDWDFDPDQAHLVARKWALSKISRLERRGIRGVDAKYLIDTTIKPITQRPPGIQNTDYFGCAIRSALSHSNLKKDEILGVVTASRNSSKVAALNVVVVPVQKGIHDLGYYTVHKLAEKMSDCGIQSYWHGPKELESDVEAVVEFFGLPDRVEKQYCVKIYTGRGYD